jgi:hypothetical protein
VGDLGARVSGIGTDADATGRVGRSPPPGRNRNGGVAAAEHGGGGSRPRRWWKRNKRDPGLTPGRADRPRTRLQDQRR